MHPLLIIAWSGFLGIVMFLVAAVVYPLIGLPPMWLLGLPLVGLLVVLVSATARG